MGKVFKDSDEHQSRLPCAYFALAIVACVVVFVLGLFKLAGVAQ